PMAMDDPRHARFEAKYADLDPADIPSTESLKEAVIRLIPYWNQEILPALNQFSEVLISAHGNSLRAAVKILKDISDQEIVEFNIPTGVPYVFEFDDDLRLIRDYFIGDPEEIRKKMEAVANQGKK
ncbi:MAG: 2,3-bisphosphoglycerate-dependent phosphoglycerate mutase, partial [Bacteroidales bacterium]|nr:2,3-bisphosphoglycerate-dependent phosphoglycerate mutase [Bacteroidales bacterium]